MTWPSLPPTIADIRRRWQEAPPRLGPWSRHPASIGLLASAREDIGVLLRQFDTAGPDATAELFCQLRDLGAARVHLTPLVARRGHHGRYRVVWTQDGRQCSAEGWCPSVALGAAVRQSRRQSPVLGGRRESA